MTTDKKQKTKSDTKQKDQNSSFLTGEKETILNSELLNMVLEKLVVSEPFDFYALYLFYEKTPSRMAKLLGIDENTICCCIDETIKILGHNNTQDLERAFDNIFKPLQKDNEQNTENVSKQEEPTDLSSVDEAETVSPHCSDTLNRVFEKLLVVTPDDFYALYLSQDKDPSRMSELSGIEEEVICSCIDETIKVLGKDKVLDLEKSFKDIDNANMPFGLYKKNDNEE